MNDKFYGKEGMHDDLEGWKRRKFWLFGVACPSEYGTRLIRV